MLNNPTTFTKDMNKNSMNFLVKKLSKLFHASSESGGGFTLIEVVVAIFVLIVGVVGVFTAIQNITFSSQINSSKLTAAYLAQEGIELVRNKRDSNWLAGETWDSDLPSGTKGNILGKFNITTTITTPPDGDDKIIVSVKVSWQEKGKNYSVTAQTELYNWYGH